MENYGTGGEGNAYHDTEATNYGGVYRSDGVDISTCSDGAGCFALGWTNPGEWLLYTVNVATAGTYTLQVRVGSNGPGGLLHVECNGINKTGSITIPNTGGWDIWQTITKTVTLEAGRQTMKVVLEANGTSGSVGALNYVAF